MTADNRQETPSRTTGSRLPSDLIPGEGIEALLAGLNPDQEEAVSHGEGPLLIVAGAGTGKTAVITRRVAYLMLTGRAKPEELLALTFTEKAAAEMEGRVDLLVPYGSAPAWVTTFHAFGDRLLREFALELGLSPDSRVLSQAEQVVFLREHLDALPLDYYRPLGDPTRYLWALANLFSRAKDEEIGPQEYAAYTAELRAQADAAPDDAALDEEAAQQAELAEAYRVYQGLKAESGLIDFGDQVFLVLRALRDRPRLLKTVQDRFRYILVDEFQDTNYAQFELVKLLATPHRNLTVVGDDDQAIYRFRGAAISNILGFREAYPEARTVVLTRNYRSSQTILDAAYRLIQHNNPDRLEIREGIEKRLVAASAYSSMPVRHLHYETLMGEADGLADQIEEWVRSGRYRCGDIAVLVRGNNDADAYLRALNLRGIPYQFSGNRGLYAREEIKLLLAYLRCLAAPDDSQSLFRLAASELYDLPAMDLMRALDRAHRRNRSLEEILREEPAEEALLSEEGRASALKLLRDLDRYRKVALKRPTGEVLYRLLTETGHLQRLSGAGTIEADLQVRNIARFFDQMTAFRELAVEDRVPHFLRHLETLMEAGEDPGTAEAALEVDAVNVLTVHKAKGLEFPCVVMPGLVQWRFPWPRRTGQIELPDALLRTELPSGDTHLQEERRLFYVGMTRAQAELIFTSAQYYGGTRSRRVSQFIQEALERGPSDEVLSVEPTEAIGQHAPRSPASEPVLEPLSEKEILTLSHQQVDDYLTCPLKYKYVHVLRVPVLHHHAVVYGRALHRAVQTYLQKKAAGKSVCPEDVYAAFDAAWIPEGFVTLEHEEARREAGREALAHFYEAEEASPHRPTGVEVPFSVVLDATKLVGRWDRLDEREGKVVIIDYKSSEVREQKKADERAASSLQLSVYALAYRELNGKIPDRVELRFLESGLVGRTKKTEEDLAEAMRRIEEAAQGIRAREFTATPSYQVCRFCAYQKICPASAV